MGLAIAHAACGREHWRYDAMVMSWDVEGDLITGPAPYSGISMGRGFREWTETLNIDQAEAAHVVRRAALIALGRLTDLQALPPEAVKKTAGVCHSFQPEVERWSSRMLASTRDYSDNPQGLLLSID